jgi:molecular chaperone GrpE
MADENGHPDDPGRTPMPDGDQAVSAGEVTSAEGTAERDAEVPSPERRHEPQSPVGDDGAAASAHRKPPHAKEDPERKPAKRGLRELLDHKHDQVVRLTKQTESLQNEVRDLKDKWLRSVAEFDNYRKRTRREWELLQQRTKAEVILDLLGIKDDFERAFSAVGDRDDDFIRGIRLIYSNLCSSLERNGVRKIEAMNATFDPIYHMAVAQIDREGAESNQVIEVVQEGYCLGDVVVRPAKVIVAK